MSREELTSGHPDDCLDVTAPPSHAASRFHLGDVGSSGCGLVATLDLTEDVITARPGPGDIDEPDVSLPAAGLSLAGWLGLTGRPAQWVNPPRVRFTTFVVTDADRLLGTAFLLTGDRDRAEDLLRTALAVAGATWTHRRTDPMTDVLRAMARRYAGPPWWPTRPVDAAPLSGDVGAGLARLSSRKRLAIVLRYHQRRTEEQTAAALGAPAGNVRSWISQGLDQLGINTRLDLRPETGPGRSRRALSIELAALAAPVAPAHLEPHRPERDTAHREALELQARLDDVHQRLPAQRWRSPDPSPIQ